MEKKLVKSKRERSKREGVVLSGLVCVCVRIVAKRTPCVLGIGPEALGSSEPVFLSERRDTAYASVLCVAGAG